MKTSILFLSLAAPFLAAAQQSGDELVRLKDSYQKAIARATAPITATYTSELKKLMEKHTRSGNLDAALAVKAEIESMTPKASETTPSATQSSPKKLTRVDEKVIEERLIGRYWTFTDGKLDGYIFSKGGTAMRYNKDDVTPCTWKIESDGAVMIERAGEPKWLVIFSENQGELHHASRDAKPVPFKLAPAPKKSE